MTIKNNLRGVGSEKQSLCQMEVHVIQLWFVSSFVEELINHKFSLP